MLAPQTSTLLLWFEYSNQLGLNSLLCEFFFSSPLIYAPCTHNSFRLVVSMYNQLQIGPRLIGKKKSQYTKIYYTKSYLIFLPNMHEFGERLNYKGLLYTVLSYIPIELFSRLKHVTRSLLYAVFSYIPAKLFSRLKPVITWQQLYHLLPSPSP